MSAKNRLNLELQIRTQPVKRALCVGVRYGHLPEPYTSLQLTSTYADVDRVKGLLTGMSSMKLREDNITKSIHRSLWLSRGQH